MNTTSNNTSIKTKKGKKAVKLVIKPSAPVASPPSTPSSTKSTSSTTSTLSLTCNGEPFEMNIDVPITSPREEEKPSPRPRLTPIVIEKAEDMEASLDLDAVFDGQVPITVTPPRRGRNGPRFRKFTDEEEAAFQATLEDYDEWCEGHDAKCRAYAKENGKEMEMAEHAPKKAKEQGIYSALYKKWKWGKHVSAERLVMKKKMEKAGLITKNEGYVPEPSTRRKGALKKKENKRHLQTVGEKPTCKWGLPLIEPTPPPRLLGGFTTRVPVPRSEKRVVVSDQLRREIRQKLQYGFNMYELWQMQQRGECVVVCADF